MNTLLPALALGCGERRCEWTGSVGGGQEWVGGVCSEAIWAGGIGRISSTTSKYLSKNECAAQTMYALTRSPTNKSVQNVPPKSDGLQKFQPTLDHRFVFRIYVIYPYKYIMFRGPGTQPGPGVRARSSGRDPTGFPPHRISPPSGT